MAATAPLSPSPHDREVIRSLMARTHEAATESRAGGQAEAWRRLNDLEPTRTLVWVNEEPWTELQHEFPEELTPVCADPFLQGVERGLRMQLFRWTHYRADMVVNDRIDSPMAIRLGDIGVPVEEAFIRNEGQDIGSHGFRRTINTLEDVARIEAPDVIHDPEETERRLTLLRELADGVIAVEPRGVSHQWFALWDRLIRNLGVQDAMLDLVQNPELVHAAMAGMRDGWLKRLRQLDEQRLLATNHENERVGSGGYAYTRDLPGADFDPAHVRPANQWGCGNAQIFAGVSPAMHEEFSLRYERPWLEQFGLVYYGCCEQLHDRLHVLESLPNLRKLSTSPWADKVRMNELCRGRYVVSLKPNPAILAEDSFSIERAEAELRADLDRLPDVNVEVILKDISTLRGEGERLFRWVEMAMRVARES